MNKTIDALKLAEELAEFTRNICLGMNWSTDLPDEAIAAIREAQAEPVQEPVALGNMKYVWDAALADAIAHSGNANETVAEPVKQEPVAWVEDIDAMPFNTFCKAIVDWRSYSNDGDSYLEGENVEVIIVKYDMTEKSAWQEATPKYAFLHEGKNQYLYTSVHVLKWKPV